MIFSLWDWITTNLIGHCSLQKHGLTRFCLVVRIYLIYIELFGLCLFIFVGCDSNKQFLETLKLKYEFALHY